MSFTPQWFPLRSERLLLRDFREDDLDDVQAYGGDPEVARYMPWGPNTPDDTREFLRRCRAQQSAWPRIDFGFAIQLAATGAVIGSIGLHLRDAPDRTVEMGYCLHRDYWRRGLISEAARALLAVAFRDLEVHRVFATCDERNTGSYSVMRSVGMRCEGLFRKDRQIKGEWRTTYLYAILREEWLSRR